jgi:hypothetical protein
MTYLHVSFLSNRHLRQPREFEILRERATHSRCRRAAVVNFYRPPHLSIAASLRIMRSVLDLPSG